MLLAFSLMYFQVGWALLTRFFWETQRHEDTKKEAEV
jgi:hypothetical protein